MGGAFAALADDATAVFANPAGLTQIIRPEVSIEGRRWGYSTPFVQGGRVTGAPTGIGLDTPGLRERHAFVALNDLSFALFVHPFDRVVVAVHRHTVANFSAVTETQGFFFESTEVPEGSVGLVSDGVFRAADRRNAVRIDIVSYGGSFAYRLSERVSVGAVVNLFQGEISNTSEFFQPIPPTLPDGFFWAERPEPSGTRPSSRRHG